MKVSKLIMTAGVLTVYIFFPAYRYYALGAMLVHGVATSIQQHKKLSSQKRLITNKN